MIFILFLCGCQNQLTIENQIQHSKDVNRVFLNSPHSITVMYEKNDGVFETQIIGSVNRIEFINGSRRKYVTWNTYVGSNFNYDMKVYVPDINEVESGKRRFQSGKTVVEQELNEL